MNIIEFNNFATRLDYRGVSLGLWPNEPNVTRCDIATITP